MAEWYQTVKSRRKELGITQEEFAKRLGITRRHLVRIETGRGSPSASLQMQIDLLLEHWQDDPELNLLIDYVRIRFPTHEVEHIIKDILHLTPDLMLFSDYAFYGYAAQYNFSAIQIMISPAGDTLGTLLELKGQGCREFEGILLMHGLNWSDFFRTCLAEQAVFKRVDLAINDMVGLLDVNELINKCNRNECISVMRHFQGLRSGAIVDETTEKRGDTLYIGSTHSDVYFCIYEKAIEQAGKLGGVPEDYPIQNRFEIRLKNERATLAVKDLLVYSDAERTAFGIIKRYVRFVDTRTDKPRDKWPLNKRWAQFCGENRQPLRLTLDAEPFDLRRTKAWIQKQVAPMLRVLIKIDAYFGNTETIDMIRTAELQERHLKILEQQTTGVEQFGGDFFE